MSKTLIVYRLYNPAYGKEGNPETLSVYKNDDNTLGYSLYMGWQSSGMGCAISNLQLKRSLPLTVNSYKNVQELHNEISFALTSGVGSNHISTYEIVNDIMDKPMPTPKAKAKSSKSNEVWVGQIPSIFGYGIMVVESSEAECKKSLKKHYLACKKSWGFDKTFADAMDWFDGRITKIEMGKMYYDDFGE
jgi:hypothetical protein